MTSDNALVSRLQFLARVLQRETTHLELTDQRLFAHPFTPSRAEKLHENTEEAERVDAFVCRFGRLQDNLGHKMLPTYLQAVGEETTTMLDNLDKAERLKLIPSADDWFAMRQLRNQMVHEYIEDPQILADALQAGHDFVPVLGATAKRLISELGKRGWLSVPTSSA